MQKIGKQIQLTVTEKQEERIGKIAKRHNIPKAKVYRNMIDVGLDLYDDFEVIGMVKIIEFSGKVRKMSKHWHERKQLKLFP